MPDEVKELEINRQIESCLVTRELIRLLEECFFNDIPGLEKFRENNIRENYSLSIRNKDGTETISGIQNYSNPQFNNSTNQIRLEVNVSRPKTLIISINFTKEKENSKISIKHRSRNPYVLVNGIYARIKEIIHTSANKNKIFHPHKFVKLLLHLVGLISAALTISIIFFVHTVYELKVVAASVSLLYILFLLGKVLKPYVVFDSNRSRIMKKIFDYIFTGLILSTVLALLKDYIIKVLFMR